MRQRQLANYLFKVLTNKFIAYFYNQNGKSPKGHDQFLLTEFFSTYSYQNSTTHDSFTCAQLGGEPWPSKRPDYNCFVGCTYCCDQVPINKRKPYPAICPKQCRPKDHQDWLHC